MKSEFNVRLIPELFLKNVRDLPNEVAIKFRGAEKSNSKKLAHLTWQEMHEQVVRFCRALTHQGIVPGDRIVHIAENSKEWLFLDLATQFKGAVHVPMNPRIGRDALLRNLKHAEPAFIYCSDKHLFHELNRLPENSIGNAVFESEEAGDELGNRNLENWLRTADSIVLENELDLKSIEPEHLLTILYTSGTTGEPKGVMLSHENIASNVASMAKAIPVSTNGNRLNLLPLSHVFARTCDWYVCLASGCPMSLGNRSELIADCREFQPTFINGVPHIFDKVMKQAESASQNSLKKLLGGRIEICNCGGAPISEYTFDYFWQNDVPLITGYGLTETSPVISTMNLQNVRKRSVGKPIENVEIEIDSDGELLVRGPSVTRGYFKDKKLTDLAFTDGWFRTGDLAEKDDDGFLYITGRKKELIVLKNGFNVTPSKIESKLDSSPLINHSIVFGENQKYLTALIFPSQIAIDGTDKESSLELRIEKEIARLLEGLATFEQVASFLISNVPIDVESGLMTAKGSLRREEIWAKFGEEIKELYQN